mmetsp:Transcript_2298/g.5759  ORF Transcript_2298/g.5759 Transcript_2298/m.5759 type:complete len:319 (-) Transcript_2298:222-1178(-)
MGTAHDGACEALRDGRLAHAGLTQQDGVVLGAARQDLRHALDLLLAAKDRVRLALPVLLIEVAAVLLSHLGLALLLLGGAGAGLLVSDLLRLALQAPGGLCLDCVHISVHPHDHRARARVHQREAGDGDVLRGNEVHAQAARLRERGLKHPLGVAAEGQVLHVALLALARQLLHDGTRRVQRDGRPHVALLAGVLGDEAQQDVLRGHLQDAQVLGFLLRQHDGLDSALGELFEHRSHGDTHPAPGGPATPVRNHDGSGRQGGAPARAPPQREVDQLAAAGGGHAAGRGEGGATPGARRSSTGGYRRRRTGTAAQCGDG